MSQVSSPSSAVPVQPQGTAAEGARSAVAPAEAASGPSVDGDRVKQLNEALVEIHSRRLADLGTDESGLFKSYAKLVGDGSVVRKHELEVLELIGSELPAFEEYVVLRAGLGELALLLETAGLRTQACEANGRRFAALTASVDRLARTDVPDDRRLLTTCGFLPNAVRAHPALAVTVDFGYNVPLENDPEFQRRLRQFTGILFAPRSFMHYRQSEAEQQAGIDYLRALGFSDFTEFARLNLMFATLDTSAASVASPATVKAAPAPASSGGFGGFVERVMSLVPEAPPPAGTSTWVDRRIRQFDMKSAFGNRE